MDPLGDSTDSDGRDISPVKEEIHDPKETDEECKNISIVRSFQVFLTDCLSHKESHSVLEGKHINEEEPPSKDPLHVETIYSAFEQDEVQLCPMNEMEVDPEEASEGVVIKQELSDWEDEEIDIVDDHLYNLSNSPKKRIRELKLLLRKETEELEEKRYSLRLRNHGNRGSGLSSKSACEPEEPVRDDHQNGNIWSDDSDNDPDYTPHGDSETEGGKHKVFKKSKKKCTFSIKKSYKKYEGRKRFACLYCKRKYKNMVKHLLAVHSDESEVKNIKSLSLGSERKVALTDLIKKFDKSYNGESAYVNKKAKNENMNVEESNGSKEIKPYGNKKWSACFYCKKRLRSISKHYMRNHGKEPFMKQLMSLPKGSDERKAAFKLIRNKGNFAYNQEVIARGEGSIISSRTQKCQDKIDNFVPCSYCLGFYKKDCLQFHEESCFQTYNCEESFQNDGDKNILPSDCSLTTNGSQELKNEVKVKKKRPRRKLKMCPPNRKVSACFYCKEVVRYISNHLIQHHDDKPYMKHVLSLPKGSEERKTALKLIRNKGNFAYNKEIILNGGGSLISHKTQKCQNSDNLLPCSYCLGFFNKDFLKKHKEKCFQNPNNKTLNECDKENTSNEVWEFMPSECSPMDIIQNLVKGNLVGEETDISLKMKRKKTKRTACYYCNKLSTKFVPHLERYHSEKADVKYILSLEKGSKERYNAIQEIRRKGNFLYNKTALNTTGGTLITQRKSENFNNYFPCEYCFGFYKLNTLIKHVFKCERNTMPIEAKKEEMKKLSELKRKEEIKTFGSTLLRCPTKSSPSLDQIILSLKNSKVALVAKNDMLIVKYGAYQLERGIMSRILIVKKMCFLAKLVMRINVFESHVTNLLESLNADIFITVLKAALQICMTMDEKIAISREKSLRTSFRHCCMIAKGESLIQKDDMGLKRINDFFALFIEHWSKPLLPEMFEARKIIENNDKVSKPEAGKGNDDGSLIDCIKKDIFQDFYANENPTSKSYDIDHCSSQFGTRKSVCFFCNKKIHKVLRHWITVHQDEPEVKKLAKLEKFSNERKLFIIALRNKGNFFHNKKVLRQKRGCLIQKRGRAVLNGHSNYLPCEYCLGFFKADGLLSHFKRCPLNPLLNQGVPIKMRITKKMKKSLIINENEDKTEMIEVIIDQMKNDNIKRTVQKDDLIKKYGKIFSSQRPNSQSCFRNTAYQMRDLARILSHCQKFSSEIKSLRDCFHPDHFGYVLSTMKEMSLLMSSRRCVKLFYARLRSSILTCYLIYKNECHMKSNDCELKRLNDCERLLNQNWMLSIEDLKQYDERRLSQMADNPTSDGKPVLRLKKAKNWSRDEIDDVLSFFSSHIKNRIIPGKLEIENFLNQHKDFKSRGWVGVKSQIHSLIRKMSRPNSASSSTNLGENFSQAGNKSDSIRCSRNEMSGDSSETPFRNKVTSSLIHQENTLQSEGFLNEQHSSVNSSDSLMKDLRDLCNEISLPSLHKPLAVKGQSDNFNENSPSEDEERTYLILSSCLCFPQEGGELNVHGCLSHKDSSVFSDQSADVVSITSSYEPISQNSQSKNDFAAVCHNGSISTKRKNLHEDSTLNEPKRHQLNEKVGKATNQQENFGSINNNSIISPTSLVKCYKNKGFYCSWKNKEVDAVLSFFSKNIKSGKIPSKVECLDCIEENQCLKSRDWVSVKSKVYNIIKSNKKPDFKLHVKNRKSKNSTTENHSHDVTDFTDNPVTPECDPTADNVSSSKKNTKSRKGIERQQWTLEENTAIENFFKEHINNSMIPGKTDCEKCIIINNCLASRSWVMVKSKVHNIITFRKRKHL